MTRLVIGYPHESNVVIEQSLASQVLPSLKEQFAGARLQPIEPPKFQQFCTGAHCSFYRLQPKSGGDGS